MVDNEVALRDAQEAAETYHAAWQDAAVWWKEKVERLEGELLGVYRDRDRLREALKRYGAHGPRCLLGGACSCGLSDLVA
jgi:CHAD domain-containing protein